MTFTVVQWVLLAAVLILSLVEVVNTWRVARGQSTRRFVFFKGRLTPAMRHCDRAWQKANEAMLPGTIVITGLFVAFVVAGAWMNTGWAMSVILITVLAVSIYNRVVGERAAEKAWME
ncbi:hypothetical protein ACFYE2_17305 [Kocuria sp. CPCC 205300]|uniref:hypothetical protein n=1 Tax=Kocuria sabuli TaxID=3071448 RepID=UPI0036DAF448